MSKDSPFKRFSAFAELNATEKDALKALAATPVIYHRNTVIRHEQDPVDGVFLLIDGWVITTASFSDGSRQVLKIHLPGDIMGAPSLALDRSAETITAVTDVIVSKVTADRLSNIFEALPRLAMLFFLTAQEERVILMDRLATLGRRSAKGSLSSLLIHLSNRIGAIGDGGYPTFEMPLNQGQIGDILGLHMVHVNRMFRALEADGLIARSGKNIHLLDVEELQRLSGLPQRRLARAIHWLPAPRA